MININLNYISNFNTFAHQMKNNLILLLLVAFASCTSVNKSQILNVKDFNDKTTSANAKIIDVRTPEEFNEGCISGAVNIDYNGANFESELANLDKNETYLIYCLSGNRSGKALDKMHELGFKNIFHLDGGIKAWQAADMPLEVPGEITFKTETPEKTESQAPDFKTAIYGDKLVFIDFNATWCGPCRKMQPFVDMIKEERPNDVLVYGIDTDQQPQLAQEYQIVNLPTVILMKKGVVLYRQEGYHDQQSLNDLVTKYK